MYSQLAYTLVDALAALAFIVGSVLFFYPYSTYAATWLFLVGSVFFAIRPLISLTRELVYFKKEKTRVDAWRCFMTCIRPAALSIAHNACWLYEACQACGIE